MSEPTDVRVVLVSVPDEDEGAALAAAIVEGRFAACVTLLPTGRSFYRWEEELQDVSEAVLLIKTVESRLDALERFITRNHSYSLPEILVLPVAQGSAEYLDWVRIESRIAPGIN